MRVFAYCRVSTEEQSTDNHYSLGNQEQRAKEYAKHKSWQIVRVRKDVASGKDTKREGYQDLLNCIQNRSIDVVVVYRLDRLSRNVRDIYDFLDMIREAGIGFVSLTEGFDTTTAMGRAMLGVAAVFAQLTREMIAENVKDGLLRRAQAGFYNGSTRGPYGYTYSKETQTLVPVPEEAKIVRQIFSMYADRKWGVNKITAFLNTQRISPRNADQWSENTISHMLRNHAYVGKVDWHGEVFPGRHEPIVAEELFRRTQKLIEGRKTLPVRSHSSEHLLAGIARCGRCGKALTVHYSTGRKDGTRHRSYRHKAKPQRGACPGIYKSANMIESAVVDEIRKLAESGEFQKVSFSEAQSRIADEQSPVKQERDNVLVELERLAERFNNWADRLDRGLIDEEQFSRQNERLLARKKELSARLDEIDRTLKKTETVEISLEAVKDALTQFPKVWDNLEIGERREFVRQLVERLDVYKTHCDLKLLFLSPVRISLTDASLRRVCT